MKTSKRQFTLIEILVVIGIILILAAIILPAIGGATKKADQTKAKAQMTNLVNAIKQFEATYGYLPGATTDTASLFADVNSCTVNGAANYRRLILILQKKEKEETGTPLVNRKKQQFLDVVGNTPGEYLDPWGNNYHVAICRDNTGSMPVSNIGTIDGLQASDRIYQSVLVWSAGADNSDNQDNVYSIPVVWNKTEKKYEIGR